MRGKIYDGRDELVKAIRSVYRDEEGWGYPMERGTLRLRVWIQGMGIMGCFGNIVVSCSTSAIFSII